MSSSPGRSSSHGRSRSTGWATAAAELLDGVCTITFPDAVHELRAGDTFIVPANEVHQVVGQPDFTAIHIMPKDIRFTFKT